MSSTTNNGSIASYTIGSVGFTLTNLGTIGTASTGSAVAASGGSDTVVNAGTIHGTTFGVTASLGISVTNTGAGAVIYGGADGVYVTGGAGSITNAASIGGGTFGIYLKAGGTVANQSGGTITSKYDVAVQLAAAGTVVNSGSIAGEEGVRLVSGGVLTNQTIGTITGAAGLVVYGGSTVVNYGAVIASTEFAFHQGVDIGQNSLLINHANGMIAGYFGVAVDGASTVTNYGTIVGGLKGVQLFEGGTLTNQSGGTISAAYGEGLWATGPATAVNAGRIADGVYLSQGYLTNQITGVISGNAVGVDGATLLNAGQIGGVGIRSGSVLTNQSGGTISGGFDGVYATGGSVLSNQSGGTISGAIGAEVYASGTVTNDSRIAGSGFGVELLLGGTLVNRTDGTITGGTGAGVGILGVPNVVYNSYTEEFYTEGYRVGNATVTNAGLISGQYGIQVRYSLATVVDSGTITGSTDAVIFSPSDNDRLVLDPGASIGGEVLGAGGVLELASAASAGTLNSLGSQFAGFTQVFVDAGADWVLNGSDTFIAGSTLTSAGTLNGSGGDAVLFAPGAGNRLVAHQGALFVGTVDGGNTIGSTYASVLELAAGTSAGPSTLSGLSSQFIDFSQIVVDAGAYWVFNPDLIPSGVTLTNAGTIGGSVIFGPGVGNRVVVDAGGVFLGTLDGGNPVGSTNPSVLELANGSSTGTLSGLGTQVIDFSRVTVDAGASWYLTSDSFAAGMTLTNAGTLSGPGGTAVVFSSGAGNRVVIRQGGTFSGSVNGGNAIGSGTASVLELAGGSAYGALSGIGTQFTDFARITVDAGAYWTLNGSNTIASGVTLTDSGTLTNNAGTINGNVTLAGGTILNDVGATIAGAITATTGIGVVSNAGTITGAVSLAAGYANLVIVYPDAVFGGTVNGNGPSSLLELGANDSKVGTLNGFATKYLGFSQILVEPSAIWNLASNTFAAGTTLTNAGTLVGSPDAVRFAAGAGNRLVIAAGGTFSGIVDGGNALGSATPSILELARGLGGGVTGGTLSGLGSTIIDFASITLDSGAYWQTTGANTIAAAATFTVSGYFSNYGTVLGNVTLAAYGGLRNGENHILDGAVIGAGTGVQLKNFGTVLSTGSPAVSFSNGGFVYNGLRISGGSYGVRISGGAGTVNNRNSITGTTVAVAILAGGSLYNAGTVTGANGIVFGAGGGTVANYGGIAGTGGTGSGVLLQAGGYVHNHAGGTISGVVGVQQTGPGAATVWNAGTISGTTDSVLLRAGAANRVVIYQGAQFHGVVDGGNTIGATAVSTLELASTSTPGVLSGLGSQYIDFGQITVDPDAGWSLSGSNTIASGVTFSLNDTSMIDNGTLVNNGVITLDPSDLTVAALTGSGSVTISAGSELEVQGTVSSGETIVFAGSGGFLELDHPASAAGSVTQLAAGSYIDLAGIDPTSVTFNAGKLDFAGGSFPLTLAAGSVFEPAVSDDEGGAEVGVICFCTGACIATPSGEVPVERLAVDDMVLTASGAMRRIVWIGVGHALAVRGRRGATTPVIVRKGALADNVPHRDLRVTKGHSFLLDGVLIPVEFLVNHRSILWDDRAQEVTIYHIELATHDVLLASGAPAESYRDDGNRRLFQNANSAWDLPPKEPCAPVLTGGPVVDAVWRRLVDRAGKRPGLPMTDDPDLHLLVDGRRLDGVTQRSGMHTFHLPIAPTSVRLISRAAAPQELGLARDPRVLGVAIRRIVATRGARQRLIEADDASLTDGFHGYETEVGSTAGFRWTDGDAPVPPALFAGFDGPFDLEVHLAATANYIADQAVRQAA